MMKKKPEEVIMHAVKGMLPHTALGKRMLTRLKVYSGSEHPHKAQNPQELKI
jgi:large subunit ribosomal protein L13